ncbi:MAG: type I restriction enzyme HsdR N-terminal domain-containing protein [Bacteroidia bacterium]|nr:type I restriction enzyme HsdR N-terminal domain-containing protein [Bacteroidia bacterium]
MKDAIWDPIRRRYRVATPEECVRQRLVAFLLERGYPLASIQVEYALSEGGRFDVAVTTPEGDLWLLAECKAPGTSPQRLWTQAWTQLRRYARVAPHLKYFAIALGDQLWCWDAQTGSLLSDFPTYPR